MDEGTSKTIEAIRATQLEANGWRADIRVDIARLEEIMKGFCQDEAETHKNLEIIRADLAALRTVVTKTTATNSEKIAQIENWKTGLWPRAIGILAIVQVISGIFLALFLKVH